MYDILNHCSMKVILVAVVIYLSSIVGYARETNGFFLLNGSYGKHISPVSVNDPRSIYGHVNVVGGISTKYLKTAVGIGVMQTANRFTLDTYLANQVDVKSRTVFVAPTLGIYSNFSTKGKVYPFLGVEYSPSLFAKSIVSSRPELEELPLITQKRNEIKNTQGFLKVTHALSERLGLGVKFDEQFSVIIGFKHTMYLNGFIYENPSGGKKNHFIGPFVSIMFDVKNRKAGTDEE